jgi:hypothetical protein
MTLSTVQTVVVHSRETVFFYASRMAGGNAASGVGNVYHWENASAVTRILELLLLPQRPTPP